MAEKIQDAIKNFELYKTKIRTHVKDITLRASEESGAFLYKDFIYDGREPTTNICFYLDVIERTDRVIEFLKKIEKEDQNES